MSVVSARSVVVALVTLAVAGCSTAQSHPTAVPVGPTPVRVSPPTTPPMQLGTVTGVLQFVAVRRAVLPGTVYLRSSGGQTIEASTSMAGIFSVRVPAGTYVITGRSPHYDGGLEDCYAGPAITVTLGATTQVAVTCQGY